LESIWKVVSRDITVVVAKATGWMTEGSKFEYRWGLEFSLLHIIQTSSGAHPMGNGGSFPGGKAAGA
jgi:hypothetical protein